MLRTTRAAPLNASGQESSPQAIDPADADDPAWNLTPLYR
jgi:hypothetical protein